jgi:predicted permease
MSLLRRLRAVFFPGAAERDLEDEIEHHLSLEAKQLVGQGLDSDTASRMARRRFGRVDSIKDALRAIRGVEPIEDLRRDLVFAARALRRRPGFATVVVLTLVIGLASATTIFSVVYGVLWAPLPYGDADRIVTLWQTDHVHGIDQGSASLPNFLDWRARSHSFAALAAAEPFGVRYAAPDGPERWPAWRVTEGFFDVLRAKPLLGRTFSPEEYQRGQNAVVVLDYDLWRTRFNADSTLVGKTLLLSNQAAQVIGVMPPGFRFPARPGIWLPKIPTPDELLLRNAAYFLVVGRLAPGVSLDRAREEMTRIGAALAQEYPAADRDIAVGLVPLRDSLVGSVRGRLLVLFGSVGLLLLLTGANLTTLFFARAVERQGEIAIRMALGAGRARITRQVLVENAVLGALGLVLSLAVTFVAMKGIRALGAGLLPFTNQLKVGLPAAIFAAVVVLGLGFTPTRSPLKGRRVQHILVVSEVALALVLVIGAGLFVRSVGALLGVDPGFAAANVLAITLQTEQLFPVDSARATFVRTVAERLAGIPGVRLAGVTTAVPFGGTIGPDQATFEILGQPAASARDRPTAHTAAISPSYFAALNIPLLHGRAFAATDEASHPRVAIVSAALARRYWGSGDPIGQRLNVAFADNPVIYEIVGVVGDVHDNGLELRPVPTLYLPYAQKPTGGVTFVLQTAMPPSMLLGPARRALAAVNASQPIASSASLGELLAASTRASRVLLTVLSAFAGLALTLAGVGIFGVMSHLTRTRTKEVSIRLALGESSRGILRLIVGEAVGLAGIGATVGIVAAALFGRSIGALLYGVSPLDPLTLAAGVALLLLVSGSAAYWPARRAAAVDAVRALRE